MQFHKHNFIWEDNSSQQVFWEFHERSSKEIQQEVDMIINLCHLPENAKILDVGCGLGLHVAEFGKRGYESTGIEILDSVVRLAKDNCVEYPNCTIYKMRGCEIPWEDEFQLVFAIEHVLGFMEPVEIAIHLKRMWEAVTPGGILLIGLVDGTLDSQRNKLPVDKWEVINDKFIFTDKRLTSDGIKREMTVVVDPVLQRIDEYNEQQQCYSLLEILNFFHNAGIDNIHTLKDLNGNPAKEEDTHLFMINKSQVSYD